jgi:prophage regulatory protein
MRFLRFPEVSALVGLKRSAILDRVARGEFPRPIRLPLGNSRRPALAWLSDEIDTWQQALVDARDAQAEPQRRSRLRDARARFAKDPDLHPENE